MDGLTIVFVQGGIVDGAHLDALVAMPDAEQREFLRDDLSLNALQARLVRLALQERRESESDE